MKTNKINFRQGKYYLPLVIYVLALFIGYELIDAFQMKIPETGNGNLKTTDYLSSALPDAKTDSLLGSKMDNTERKYGRITDLTGLEGMESDRDSVRKKEEFESQYNKKEAELIKKQEAEQEELKKLRAMQSRVRENSSRESVSNDEFVAPVSNSEIARLQRKRRTQSWEEMNRNLSGVASFYDSGENEEERSSSRFRSSGKANSSDIHEERKDSHVKSHETVSSSTDETPEMVTKKSKDVSDYFNTLGIEKNKSKLISAIIDEEVKAVDGTRVRLRLLDDIEIGGTTVNKGTYIYAQMSDFGKQRVKGKVESIFFEEEILRVNLSLYDTDGLEGLYVPQSSFRETTKDIASSATQGSNLMESSTGGTGIKSWASRTMSNASQKAMNALGRNVKKNRAKLKYGTKVYLVDTSSKHVRTKL